MNAPVKEPAPIPAVSQNILDFPKTSSEEIFVDKDEDTMYVTDSVMQEMEQNFSRENETQQQKLITPVNTEPEQEENIIGQYKNTYILIEKDDGLE